ncbi:MAG: hypothetical protein IPP49_20565 [Saprospiraceae bacterium]|nr:hypothetical protein [Saprospiraceae bacterium]
MKIKILAWMNIFFLMACSFSQKVKDGEMAFERKQYSVAVAMLEKEFEEVKMRLAKPGKLICWAMPMADCLNIRNPKTGIVNL